jgi:hypothetical protein
MDKNRSNAKPAEDQGVIVAGTDARARARGEVKDDRKPRDVRDAPTENPPTGDERKGPPTPAVGADVPSRPLEHDGRKPISGA